ncbi:11600_t:CDS:2, partial [Scutellospora calospora]
MQGEPKGIKLILKERGLWKDRLLLECKEYKKLFAIVELIESTSHLYVFYSKFYCKLNFIEMYWEAAKNYTRNNCNYTWASLQKTVLHAFDLVGIIKIRKFARKSWRYIELYHEGLTGKLA